MPPASSDPAARAVFLRNFLRFDLPASMLHLNYGVFGDLLRLETTDVTNRPTMTGEDDAIIEQTAGVSSEFERIAWRLRSRMVQSLW
jgi:hypothetical protein